MSIHCCRMPYLIRVLGQEVFDCLYEKLFNINCIQIIFSYLPDEQVKTNHKLLLEEISCADDIIVYCIDYRNNQISWTWDDRWEVSEYLMENYYLGGPIWDKFKLCRFVFTTDNLLQIDECIWTMRDLEILERIEYAEELADMSDSS